MKKYIIALLLFSAIAVSCGSDDKDSGSKVEYGRPTRIYQDNGQGYTFEYNGRQLVKMTANDGSLEYEYQKGELVATSNVYRDIEDPSVWRKAKTIYKRSGSRITSRTSRDESAEWWESEYELDGQGRTIRVVDKGQFRYEMDGSIKNIVPGNGSYFMSYDSRTGSLIKTDRLDNDGILKSTYVFSYDQKAGLSSLADLPLWYRTVAISGIGRMEPLLLFYLCYSGNLAMSTYIVAGSATPQVTGITYEYNDSGYPSGFSLDSDAWHIEY